jgi:outer membrane receptor for Fe3+-dicitrate
LIIAKGSQLPINSKNKVTAAVHYERSVGSNLTLSLDSRYRWASKTFSDPGNTPAFVNQPTSQLYLGATLSGGWGRVTVFADNVFDRADTTAKYPPPGPPLYIYSSFLRPRNFGLEFKRTF